ncbi:MAG: hypothetical protein ACE5IT_02335 [bacterium]
MSNLLLDPVSRNLERMREGFLELLGYKQWYEVSAAEIAEKVHEICANRQKFFEQLPRKK